MAVKFMRCGQQGIMFWDEESNYKFGIDLFLSDEPGRKLQNLVGIDDLRDVNLLFGTHDHIDHIDRQAWRIIGKKHPHIRFVAPKLFEDDLPKDLDIPKERFIFIDENEKIEEGPITIEAVQAAHEFVDETPEGLHPYLMYIVSFNGKKICHMGDTCLYEGVYEKLRNHGPYDVMFPPINGRDAKRYKDNIIGNMTYQEAADLIGVLEPALAVPGHYDMFDFNSADPMDFLDYVNIKYPAQKVEVLGVGEEYTL